MLLDVLRSFDLTDDRDANLAALAGLSPERLEGLHEALCEQFDANHDRAGGPSMTEAHGISRAIEAVRAIELAHEAAAVTASAGSQRGLPSLGDLNAPASHQPAVDDDGRAQITAALVERFDDVMSEPVQVAGRVRIASLAHRFPEERTLSDVDAKVNDARIDAVVGPDALTASGGFCAPSQGYYQQLQSSSTARPIRDALPGFGPIVARSVTVSPRASKTSRPAPGFGRTPRM
jgi:hypothetical protein